MGCVWKRFWRQEEGLGTVEIVILVAVLVAVALIFGGRLKEMVKSMTQQVGSETNSELYKLTE